MNQATTLPRVEQRLIGSTGLRGFASEEQAYRAGQWTRAVLLGLVVTALAQLYASVEERAPVVVATVARPISAGGASRTGHW